VQSYLEPAVRLIETAAEAGASLPRIAGRDLDISIARVR
jgi:hypothetical protein